MTSVADEDGYDLNPQMVRVSVGSNADRVSLILFGASVEGLVEPQMRAMVEWGKWKRCEHDLRRHAVRNLTLALASLALLFGGIDERLEVRPAWGEAGYLDIVVDAQALGTRIGYEAMCEDLEASWHDMRLTMDEGIAAVEAVERVRDGLRRLEACDAAGNATA